MYLNPCEHIHNHTCGSQPRYSRWLYHFLCACYRQVFQLSSQGRGQLKHLSGHLKSKEDVLYLDERLVVPTSLRNEAIERVNWTLHFKRARTIELMKKNYHGDDAKG